MLTDREQSILKEIVDSYVETAIPVGSRTVAQRLGMRLSPATIRNTMMDLEERGLIDQPHTSAGRVPTDLGYRAYVDGLMEPGELSEVEGQWIEGQFASAPSDLAGLLDQAARLLAGASHQLGLVLTPSFDQGVLEGIELVRVSPHRVLVLLRVQQGLARTVVLDIASGLDNEWLARTAARLNERLVGLTVGQIRRSLAERVRADDFENDEVVLKLLASGGSWFSGNEDDGATLYVGGTTNIVSQPEFQIPERMLGIMALVEERTALLRLLAQRQSPDASSGSGVRITIGHENPAGPLASTSIVTCAYSSGAISGMLGIIGPTRMPYHRIVGILHRVGLQIDRRFSA